jgi:hypothetical protein
MTSTVRTAASRPRRLLALTVAGGLVLAACGNSGDDDEAVEESAAPPTEAPEPTAAATEETTDTAPSTETTAETTAPSAETTETADTEPPPETTEPEPSGDEIDLGEFQPIRGVPGVNNEAINFAVMGTGPANPLGYCLLECYLGGVQAYFEWRNSLGGVHGRDLVIGRTDDDELANTQVTLLEIAGDDSVFGVFAAPLQPVGFEATADVGMPLYTTFPSSTGVVDVPSSFVPGGISCIDCSNPMDAFIATLVGKSTAAGLGLGVSEPSKECVDHAEANMVKFGPGAGIEWAYKNNELPFGLPNGLGPEVAAMKEVGVDFVTTCIDQNSALTLERELARQGMNDTVVVLPQGYGDAEFISANADVLEGSVLGVSYRPLEADPGDSITPTMVEWFDRIGVLPNDYAVQGWLGADLAVTGLLAAGPQFDRASVVDATNALTGYDAGGLLPPMDWATGHQAPGHDDQPFRFCLALVRVSNGAIEMLSDPVEPWFCFDGPLDEYTEPYKLG